MERARPLDHLILALGAGLMAAPLILAAVVALGQSDPGDVAHGLRIAFGTVPLNDNIPSTARVAINAAIVALALALAKTLFALLAAYALVFFRPRMAAFAFWAIMLALLFPLETRMAATIGVVERIGLVRGHESLIVPLAGSALATLAFYWAMRAVPPSLVDAARLDGAGPIGFLLRFAIPLTWPMIAAVFLLTLVDGWNQYLWPVLNDGPAHMMLSLTQFVGTVPERVSNPAAGLALALIVALPAILVTLLFAGRVLAALTGIARSAGARDG